MESKIKERELAIKLRMDGYSLKEISDKLKIAKILAYIWVRKIKMDKKARNIEINQISNTKLKQKISNTATYLLFTKKLIGENELKNGVQVEYGYIFSKEDGSTEALLKIYFNSDSKIFYFGVQNENITMLNIMEVQYVDLVRRIIDCHECLKKNDINESEKQKNRRINNNQYLKKNGITFNENLPCYVNDEEVKIKNIDEICKRAISCLITIQIACDINKGDYQESLNYFLPLYKKFNIENCLNSKEQRIIDGTYTNQDVIDMDWAYEAYWSICWCLGLIGDLKDASKLCNCDKAISFIMKANSFDNFKNKCKLRTLDEILDIHDLYYRYDWAINNRKINPDTAVGSLNSSNIIERRRGLEWVISSVEDWYDLSLNA